jgi:hypothetical protein
MAAQLSFYLSQLRRRQPGGVKLKEEASLLKDV